MDAHSHECFLHMNLSKRMGRERERASCIVRQGKDFNDIALEDSSYLKPIISLNCPQAFTCVLGGECAPKYGFVSLSCPQVAGGPARKSKPTASSHASRDLKAELACQDLSLSHTHFQIQKMNSSQSFCPVGDLCERMLWITRLRAFQKLYVEALSVEVKKGHALLPHGL